MKIGGNGTEENIGNHFSVTFKRTRKCFLLEYAIGILLLCLLAASYIQDVFIRKEIQYFVLGLALFAFAFAEVSRLFVLYEIQPDKIIIVRGLIKKEKQFMYFQPSNYIPDIHSNQTMKQRLLGYGTISMKGEGGNHIELYDINKPQEVMKFLEDLIEKKMVEKR